MTPMEREVLEECAGLREPRKWGAAVGACLESLRGNGLIDNLCHPTAAGQQALSAIKNGERG